MADNSEASKTPVDIAKECIGDALAPFFKGKLSDERHQAATDAALAAIVHLNTVKDTVRKKPLGATIMTEQASGNIRPGISPRNV